MAKGKFWSNLGGTITEMLPGLIHALYYIGDDLAAQAADKLEKAKTYKALDEALSYADQVKDSSVQKALNKVYSRIESNRQLAIQFPRHAKLLSDNTEDEKLAEQLEEARDTYDKDVASAKATLNNSYTMSGYRKLLNAASGDASRATTRVKASLNNLLNSVSAVNSNNKGE